MASEFPLAPYLPTDAGDAVPDVTVCRQRDRAPGIRRAVSDASIQRVRLAWYDLAIDVRNGAFVTVDDRQAPGDELAQFVAGPVMGTVLTQRGYFVLHASAVRIGGEVVAFTAPSGVGKSTLAVLLAGCGAEYLADDIVVVRMDDDVPRMVTGPRVAKVADERLVPGWTVLAREGLSGRCVACPAADERGDGEALPLARICVVTDGASEDPVRVTTLSGASAVMALADADFGAPLVPPHARGGFLRRARDLAASLRVERLTRPRRLDVGPAVARALGAHTAA